MAKRGREAALKRAREKARQEKREAKLDRRQAKQSEGAAEDAADEQALMEEFAQLSELHETNQISSAHYNTERQRIFVELGIESDD